MNYKWNLINDSITDTDRSVLSEFCLKSKRFTNGDKVKEFEKKKKTRIVKTH